jgi:hypothetical protein
MPAPEIPVKSPIAIIGVMLSILRERFSQSQGLPWVWAPEMSTTSLDNTITIEVGSEENIEATNRRPGIYVKRGPVSYLQSVIGDKHAVNRKSGSEVFYATADTSFTFVIEAEEEGEAAMLADVVLSTFMMGADLIERAYKFRKLGPFSISAASQPIHDTDVCQIQVTMGLTFDVRWGTLPIAPLLNEIVVKMNNSSYNSSEEYFNEIYQGSFRHKN